jgi:F420 biosynthesis protein FbiB-like protein
MGERLRADRLRDGDALAMIERDIARSKSRIQTAPACMIVCLTMEIMDIYLDQHRANAERIMAVQSTAMALENMLLAAHAGGLGTSIMCAPLFCPETVVEVLDLPPGWEPQALVTIGYPDAPPKPFDRRPFDDMTRVIRVKT